MLSVANAKTRNLNPQPLPPGMKARAPKAQLNPQPLPPGAGAIAVNPQPLPPGNAKSVKTAK